MTQSVRRWTSSDLDQFPDDDGQRYEIIDGELFVSKQPSWEHQGICGGLTLALGNWSLATGAGFVRGAPGVIFAEDDDVAPDLVWVSAERLPDVLGADGKLHGAPDLVIEVLSPGARNERRDREAKLALYSRRGVAEYWIVDWRRRKIDCYRRDGDVLALAGTLGEADVLQSPLLPEFSCPVRDLFERLSR